MLAPEKGSKPASPARCPAACAGPKLSRSMIGTITGNAVELSFGSTLGTSTYSGIVNETLDTISGVFLARNMGSVGVSDCEVELELVKSKF